MNILKSLFRPRNILIIPFVLVLILFISVRLSPNISLSSLAEEYVPLIAPWIWVEHYNKTTNIKHSDILGYVNRHSVSSGESFKLFLSRTDSEKHGVVEVYRIGYYENSDREMVYKSGNVSVANGEISFGSFATGAAWKPLDNDISTSGWRTGYYTIDFIQNDGDRVKDVAYVVVTNPQQKGDILIKISTNTYQAYNDWGGSSLYKSELSADSGVKHSDVVSFDRPTESLFNEWEYYYVVWLEEFAKKHDLTIDYATNYDFYREPDIATNYTTLISLGHDEYWTQEEFDAYYDRIFKQGKNTMFLSANTAYWRVRYGDLHHVGEGRQLIVYKTSLEDEARKGPSDPIIHSNQGGLKASGLFRGLIGYPEMRLMGVAYEAGSWFGDGHLELPSRFTYRVKAILPWLFEGTDLNIGDNLADVLGPEWDNTLPVNEGAAHLDENIANIPSLDALNMQIIFEGDVINYKDEQNLAQAVYFETAAGAKVFSAGTIRWAWGVGKSGFVNKQFQIINENLITHFND